MCVGEGWGGRYECVVCGWVREGGMSVLCVGGGGGGGGGEL